MININKLKYLFVLLAFFGCDSKLDIEPQQSIDQDLALNTSENVMAVLVGAYDALGDDDVYGGEILLQTDLLASTDELTWVGTFESPREVFNKIINAVNSQIEVTWSESYETINIVNNVLGALDVVDEDLKAQIFRTHFMPPPFFQEGGILSSTHLILLCTKRAMKGQRCFMKTRGMCLQENGPI